MTNARRDEEEEEVEEEEAGQSRPLRLDELPLEILLLIFDYCHAFDLVRLSGVCTRFYDVAHDEVLWYKRSKQTLATNQVSKRFRSRYALRLLLRILFGLFGARFYQLMHYRYIATLRAALVCCVGVANFDFYCRYRYIIKQ